MFLSTFKSLSTWISLLRCIGYTTLFCFIVGLLQMFSREITVDSVRNIDFQLIQDFSAGFDLQQDEDRVSFKRAIDNLAGSSGKAFYPIALVGEDFCIENGALFYLCKKYPSLRAIEAELALGESTTSYGTRVLKTADEKYFYIGKATGKREWLIGEAGQYLAFPADSWKRELTFLKGAPYYFMDKRGFRKMWQKNRWIWLVCFSIAIMLWGLNLRYRLRIEKKTKVLKEEKDNLESKISDMNNEVNILRLRSESLESEIEAAPTLEEQEMLRAELSEAKIKLEGTEEESLAVMFEKDAVDKELNGLRKKLSSSAKAKDAEAMADQLKQLKSLWQKDPKWLERYEVEYHVATNNKKRTPFTLFIAFSGLERYLTNTCYRYCIEATDNLDRINKLFEEKKIDEKKKDLLHEARLARNDWFHEGKFPDSKLLSRLLNLLEKEQTHPRV